MTAALFDAMDATWPAAAMTADGPWQFRVGDGGGKRVSATSALGAVTQVDIDRAEQVMTDAGQDRLFMLHPGDTALDQMLAARGYAVVDPVTIYACPTAQLTDTPLPRVSVFSIWEPLAMMVEIWDQGGIGPARLRVMERAQGPKTGFLARYADKPAGTAFAAIHDDIAMVHAVEILPHQRRNGMGQWIMRAAGFWAAEQGAKTVSVMCTKANTGANALYQSLGLKAVGDYHYRLKTETPS